ncbi:MAG: sugar-binding transcriptional regulator [bacterium]
MRRLLYRIAQAYYQEDLTQAEIAERFGVSRIKVSRMLTRAREDGIVRITVVPPQEDRTGLERGLEQAFGLDEAIVAEPDGESYEGVLDAIGRAAAEYVIRVLEDGSTIGLTWGNSILATVSALPHASLANARVVQLLGGLGALEAEIHGAELVRLAAERLGCRPRNIHAPGIVASREVRDALVADAQVADTLALGRRADVALLGIGALGPHSVLRGHGSVLSKSDCRALLDLGIVGDIALRFFDADGRPVDTEYGERTIGLDLDDLHGIGKRVGIAGGQEKHDATLAALCGGHVNVLVTDPVTARTLIERAR